ncbi:D-2-hydroxyacid dehydrogenase [Oscillospiraceae bacterium HV4-5-C5C]|nr:D-2-hydroxyacid dehydrogenase [Oscillospiraceae bacterium HV4-5-C5C]
MKIVVLDGHTLNPGDLSWSRFEAMGAVTVYERSGYSAAERATILQRAQGADVLLINKTPLDRATLPSLRPELKYIGILATGYNVVDLEAAALAGITVTNIPGYGTRAVAQHAFALLLELTNHCGLHDRAVKAGRWSDAPDFCFWDAPLTELEGKTMGIVGLGRIGQQTAKLAAAFGMKVIAYHHVPIITQTAELCSWDELLHQSDVISLHCPLTASTQHLIDRQALSQMKRQALLINTSRGPLINEADLAAALQQGVIAGAGLDVVAEEPITKSNPLLTAPNCILTPHIAWASQDSRQRLLNLAADNLAAFIAGQPQNVVSI